MIGTINPRSNDVWVYLTPKEISTLEKQTIEGDYIGMDKVKGKLILSLDDKKCRMELAGYAMEKSSEGKIINLAVYISSNGYRTLKERRKTGFHLGYSHINLIDIDSMRERNNFNDNLTYRSLILSRDKSF